MAVVFFYFSQCFISNFCDSTAYCVCLIIPSSGKVGPVGNHVAGDVTVARPVCQWRAERLSEHVLQVIRMVGSHPAGVGSAYAAHTVGLGE